jgi:MFS-type transporter involved in bile tolerance (Atg22 family)
MALAWMFQNALLPSVAGASSRPTLSLISAGLSNLGAALFLLLMHHVVSEGEDASHTPSEAALDLVCLLAAAVWALSAAPSVALLATLRSEPLATPDDGDALATPSPADDSSRALPIGAASPTYSPDSWGPPHGGLPLAKRAAAREGEPLLDEAAQRGVRVGIGGVFAAFRRMRQHKHAMRFVLAQTL